MRKIISSSLILAFVVSCGNDIQNINYYPESNTQTNQIQDQTSKLSFNSWKRLMLDERKNNLSLAKIFVTQIDKKDAAEVEKFITENLNVDEMESIIKEVSARFKDKRNAYFFHNAPWEKDQYLMASSLMDTDEIKTLSSDEFYGQLYIEAATRIKNKFLTSILNTYSENIHQTAKELAPQFALKIQKDQPALATQIESDLKMGKKDAAIAKIKKGLQSIDYFNQLRHEASLKDSEVVYLGLASVIAAKIYDEIKDSKTFNTIKKVVAEVKVIQAKLKKASAILDQLNQLNKNSASEIANFKKASKDMASNSRNLISAVSSDLRRNPENDPAFSEKMKILYKEIYKKKRKPGEHDSERLGQYNQYVTNISSNLETMATSMTNVSKNFDAAINGALQLVDLFGIKLGKDAQKIVKFAKTASKIVNVAAATFSGFASGGYAGAATALIGSSGLLGSGENQEMARISDQLNVMDQKLDEILKLQKEMIRLQLENMKMIRDLALMIDDYHQEEMRALSQLKDLALTNMELSQSMLNKEIRECETLISFHLDNSRIGTRSQSISFIDASIMDMTHKMFYSNIKRKKSFQQIIRSTNFNSFSDCQSGLSNAFGRLNLSENPILATYSSTSNVNFVEFARDIYQPLTKEIFELMGNLSDVVFPLHLPILKMNNLDRKLKYLANPTTYSGESQEIYDLKNLISVQALTRYASSLLVLYPLLDFDRSSWEMGPEAVIDQFFSDLYEVEDSSDTSRVSTRAQYLLKNALFLTQSAIAQEAILSGEPLLNIVWNKRQEIFQNDESCNLQGQKSTLSCAVRSNPLLLQNFIRYSLFLDFENYQQAYQTQDVQLMSKTIGSGTDFFKVDYNQEKKIFELTMKGKSEYKVTIPKFESRDEIEILYTENMVKLLKLQALVTDALISTSPQFFNPELKKKYSAILLQ